MNYNAAANVGIPPALYNTFPEVEKELSLCCSTNPDCQVTEPLAKYKDLVSVQVAMVSSMWYSDTMEAAFKTQLTGDKTGSVVYHADHLDSLPSIALSMLTHGSTLNKCQFKNVDPAGAPAAPAKGPVQQQ